MVGVEEAVGVRDWVGDAVFVGVRVDVEVTVEVGVVVGGDVRACVGSRVGIEAAGNISVGSGEVGLFEGLQAERSRIHMRYKIVE